MINRWTDDEYISIGDDELGLFICWICAMDGRQGTDLSCFCDGNNGLLRRSGSFVFHNLLSSDVLDLLESLIQDEDDFGLSLTMHEGLGGGTMLILPVSGTGVNQRLRLDVTEMENESGVVLAFTFIFGKSSRLKNRVHIPNQFEGRSVRFLKLALDLLSFTDSILSCVPRRREITPTQSLRDVARSS